MKSEVDAQKSRPGKLKKLSRPMNPTRPPRTPRLRRRYRAGTQREHLLDHQRRLAENADARGDVENRARPEEPELRSSHRLVAQHARGRNELHGAVGDDVACRF